VADAELGCAGHDESEGWHRGLGGHRKTEIDGFEGVYGLAVR